MSDTARKHASYEDLKAVPKHLLAQIIDGELIVLPDPDIAHHRASSVIGVEITDTFDYARGRAGGWWILDRPEVHLGNDVLSPDLAGWRRERLAAVPAEPYLSLPPDWVCEVLSPATACLDRVQKLAIYARERVSHVWLIDPEARTFEVFRNHRAGWLRVSAFSRADAARAEPFETLELDVASLWHTHEPAPE